MALPAAQSCMSYDTGLMVNADGMAALSVRGYVYEGADTDPEAAPLAGAMISVEVFDRDCGEGDSPLAAAVTAASDDGYYETGFMLQPDGDVIIKVLARKPDGNGNAAEARCVYAWRSGLYDPSVGSYCANLAPIYIQ